MVGLPPYTVCAFKMAKAIGLTSMTATCMDPMTARPMRAVDKISSFPIASFDSSSPPSSSSDVLGRAFLSDPAVIGSVGHNLHPRRVSKKPEGGNVRTRNIQRKQGPRTFLVNALSIKKGGLLGLWKLLLPILWIANACTSLPQLSTASLLASVAVVVAPLLGDLWSQKVVNLKVAVHHFIRDFGLFEMLVLFAMNIPKLLFTYDSTASDFLKLRSVRTRIRYGTESPKRQVLDLYMPFKSKTESGLRGLVFFVWGGAWGSGHCSWYTHIAKPFLAKGLSVAIVGYRTYPEGDVSAQVQDLELAAAELARRYPQLCLTKSEFGVTVMAHSSGAHIASMMLLQRLRQQLQNHRQEKTGAGDNPGLMRIDSFIGISGPYNIANHFQFEASRGLEELSPMQPACGGKSKFHENSPMIQISHLLSHCSAKERRRLSKSFPRTALVHGSNDDTVPVTSSKEAAKLLRSSGIAATCDELYVAGCGHIDPILQIMFGGRIQDEILSWIEGNTKTRRSTTSQTSEELFETPVSSIQSLLNVQVVQNSNMINA